MNASGAAERTRLPGVTVIMPVRNEEAMIARSLGAVLAQDYPAALVQVLVADGESTDRTREIIATLPGSERVQIVSNPRRRQAAGLNIALAHATGDIVVRVDGHTVVAPDYLRMCVRALREHRAAVVGGGMWPVGTTATGKAIAAATRSRFAVPSIFRVATTGRYTDTVYMGAWPRAVLVRMGGLDEACVVNEDYELNWRIRCAGGRVYFDPAIQSIYYGRQSYRALLRQYFAYGKDKLAVLRRHPRSLRPRQLVAPVFVLALAALPFALAAPSALLHALGFCLLFAYLACDVSFSALAARRTDARLFARIALVFPAIHLAWGAGFWCAAVAGAGAACRRASSRRTVAAPDPVAIAAPSERL